MPVAKKSSKKAKKHAQVPKYEEIPAESSVAQVERTSDPACTSIGCKTDTVDPFTKKSDPGFPTGYKVPNLGMDKDIKDSQKNMDDAETKHGKWTLPKKDSFLQSDPICATADCPEVDRSAADGKIGHPVDYPVPSFGADPDIEGTLKHENEAAQAMGHTWTIEEDKPVPTEDAEFKLTAIKSEVNADKQSDPTFNSADGYEVRHHKGEGAENLSNVPDDMPIPDNHVAYNFDPKLDSDIISTHSSAGIAEGQYQHKYLSTVQVQSEVDALEKEFNEIKHAADVQENHSSKVQKIAVTQMTPKTPSLVQTGTGVMTAARSTARFMEVRKKMMSNWGTK